MTKWLKFLKIIIVLLLFLVLPVLAVGSFYLTKISRNVDVNLVEQSEETFDTDEHAEGEIINPNDVVWPNDISSDISNEETILQDKERINIMLIGQDRRPGESRARSDSMILATINKKDNTLKLTSFMRDLYVQIPGYSDNRLNASYAFGGMQLLDETISHNFHIQIDGNIEVDFDRFIILVDKIGGIDIVINKQEAEELNIGVDGLVHMDGSTALNYSEIRDIGNGDYERTQRQRNLLVAAYGKVKNLSFNEILSLIDQTLPYVTTDLTNIEIIKFALIATGIDVAALKNYRIPMEGAYKPAVINKMQVLVPDLEKNQKELERIFLE